MRIDLSCPAELWRYELPKEDYPICGLMLYNLGEKIIVSVEVTLILLDREGEEEERVIYRAHDLDGRSRTAFAVQVPVEEKHACKSAEAVIEKIWFDDNSVWRRGKYALSEYTSNALPNSRSLEMLRYVAGDDAVGFPQEQNGLWLCVCGRPNAAEERVCVRCGRDREQVFTQDNREANEKLMAQREQQLALKTKAAQEDATRLQMMREKVYEEKKKKRRRVASIAAACVLVAGAGYGTVFHLLPYLRYRTAVKTMEAGRYEEAQAAFSAMGEYGDAQQNVLECRYRAAGAQVTEQADEETLLQAREALKELGDYKDAATLVKQADYLRAKLLLEKQDIAAAKALYTALDGYENSAEYLQKCNYLEAEALLEAGSYDAAYTSFTALGTYDGAQEMAKECVYRMAEEALKANGVETAIAQFSRIEGYRDADEKLKEAHYRHASALMDAQDLAGAGEEYRAAGDYLDAQEMAKTCLYQSAEEALNAGNVQDAVKLYSQIPGYEDATEKYYACALSLAQTAIKDREYQLASGWLNALPDTYENVLELRQECVYLPAVASLNARDYQAAVDGFSRISTYKDSADKLTQARYALAGEKSAAGDHQAALELYTLLGSYKESESRVTAERYAAAAQKLQNGAWQEAEEAFIALGDYKDSADKVKEARYHLAQSAYESGDYSGAREQFTALEGYSDAAVMVQKCDYALAKQAAEAGKTADAAAMFETIAGYEDASQQACALYYALGEEAQKNGQTLQAARNFAHAKGYRDADTLAEKAFDDYYQEAAISAQDAMDNEAFGVAAALLGHMDLADLPAKYANLAQMQQEANYQQANKLYAAGKPYEALAYYARVQDYKDVQQRMDRTCYRILGTWRTTDGREYVFRPDGTCTLNGEKLCFRADIYALYTGATADTLKQTHSVSSVDASSMTLRDTREEQTKTIRLTKVADAEMPTVEEKGQAATMTELPLPEMAESAETETPATATDAPGSFLVTEDE